MRSGLQKLRLAVPCVVLVVASLSILDLFAPTLLEELGSVTLAAPHEPVSCTTNRSFYQGHTVELAELKECPVAKSCNACAKDTCAQCVRAGGPTSVDPKADRSELCGEHREFAGFTSNMLIVRRIMYTHGVPWAADPTLPACFDACKPSYNPSVDWKPFGQLRLVDMSRHQEKAVKISWQESHKGAFPGYLSCSGGTWERHALVVPAYGLNHVYHGAIDNVLLIFITLTTLGLDLGCPKQRIEVYVEADVAEITDVVKGIWVAMLGTLHSQDDMHGCFESVVYGFMFESRIHKIGSSALTEVNSAIRHPVMSSWMRAYSLHLVQAGRPTDLFRNTSSKLSMLLYRHQRMPKWMWRYEWARVGDAVGMTFVKAILSSSVSLKSQIRQAQQSAGMLSVHGSALTNVFFLRPGSMVIEINIPNAHETAYCEDLPRTWHSVDSLHLGHTTISWRFCGREQPGNKYGKPTSFTHHDPVKVIKLLMDLHAKRDEQQPSLCFILQNASQTTNWPTCDLVVTLPLLSLQSCGSVGLVGQPFKFNDTSIDVAYPWERSKSLGTEWRDCPIFERFYNSSWTYDPKLEALLELDNVSTSEASANVYVEGIIHDAHVLDIKYNLEVDAQTACNVDTTCKGYSQLASGHHVLLRLGSGSGYRKTWSKDIANRLISVKIKQGSIKGSWADAIATWMRQAFERMGLASALPSDSEGQCLVNTMRGAGIGVSGVRKVLGYYIGKEAAKKVGYVMQYIPDVSLCKAALLLSLIVALIMRCCAVASDVILPMAGKHWVSYWEIRQGSISLVEARRRYGGTWAAKEFEPICGAWLRWLWWHVSLPFLYTSGIINVCFCIPANHMIGLATRCIVLKMMVYSIALGGYAFYRPHILFFSPWLEMACDGGHWITAVAFILFPDFWLLAVGPTPTVGSLGDVCMCLLTVFFIFSEILGLTAAIALMTNFNTLAFSWALILTNSACMTFTLDYVLTSIAFAVRFGTCKLAHGDQITERMPQYEQQFQCLGKFEHKPMGARFTSSLSNKHAT